MVGRDVIIAIISLFNMVAKWGYLNLIKNLIPELH